MDEDWTYAGEEGSHREESQKQRKRQASSLNWWDRRVTRILIDQTSHWIAAPAEVAEVVDMLERTDSAPNKNKKPRERKLDECMWCDGKHPSATCEHKMTVREAAKIIGTFRCWPAAKQHRDGNKDWWLDGVVTTAGKVLYEAAKIQRARFQKHT